MSRLIVELVGCRRFSPIRAALLGAVLLSPASCGEEPTVAPEQRMRVVTLAPDDRDAIAAPRFDSFREALLLVRLKEAQRPVPGDAAVSAKTLATFNTELEAVTISVITIIRTDGWSWDDRQLMNRALRRASAADLQTK